ncbi:MAG: hypothetical protein AB7S44_02190 [Spirochaetales bacterium]
MKIQKVITDSIYKQQYVLIDNQILDEEYAITIFPEFKQQILDAKYSDDAVLVPGVKFPDIFKMLDEIAIQMKVMFNQLNVQPLLGISKEISFSKNFQVAKIFDYIASDFRVDTRVAEEQEWDKENYNNLVQQEKSVKSELRKVLKRLLSYRTVAERRAVYSQLFKLNEIQKSFYHISKLHGIIDQEKHSEIINKKMNIYKELINKQTGPVKFSLKLLQILDNNYKNVYQRMIDEEIYVSNLQVVRNVYDALILKRGVCEQLAYGNAYPLNQLNIPNNLVCISQKGLQYKHIINAIENESKDAMYLCDITLALGNNGENKIFNTNLKGFMTDYWQAILEGSEGLKIEYIAKIEDSFDFNSNENKYDMWRNHADEEEQIKDFAKYFLTKEQLDEDRSKIISMMVNFKAHQDEREL